MAIEKDNYVPPLTNKSPPGGSSLCVEVNSQYGVTGADALIVG
ncbi:MAG: hypothetical protein WCC26_03865 [Terracidiphilus sp.]